MATDEWNRMAEYWTEDWSEQDWAELLREDYRERHSHADPEIRRLQERIDRASTVTDEDIARAKRELGIE